MTNWAPSDEEFRARIAAFNREEEGRHNVNSSAKIVAIRRDGASASAAAAIGKVLSRDKAPAEPSIDQVPAFSDDWLALTFTKRHANSLRYCAQWAKWIVWDGARWKIDETKKIFDLVRKINREVAVECNELRASKQLASSKTVAAVKTLAESDRQHATTSDQWDADAWRLATRLVMKWQPTGEMAGSQEYARCGCASRTERRREARLSARAGPQHRRCVGHLRRTARGIVACDSNDKLVGVYANADEGLRYCSRRSTEWLKLWATGCPGDSEQQSRS